MMTKALAANGAHRIYIVGRREDVLRSAAESINPEIVIPLPGDVTCRESLLGIAKQVEAETGYINLLICNAGIMGPKPLKAAPGAPLPSLSDNDIEYRRLLALPRCLVRLQQQQSSRYAHDEDACYIVCSVRHSLQCACARYLSL